MNGLQEEYSQLISLAQLHLLQEYEKETWFTTDKNTYESFRDFALKNRQQKPQAPGPQTPVKKTAPTPKIKRPPPPKPKDLKKLKHSEPQKPDGHTNELEKDSIKQSVKSKLSFEQQEIPVPPADDFKDIREMVGKLFPKQKILDSLPDEQSLKVEVVPEVIVLLDEESPQHLSFLANLAKAIQLCLCPVAVLSKKSVEKESQQQSDNIKMIIGQGNHLEELSTRYTKAYLYSLPDIDGYLENPETKAALWDNICKEYKERSS